METSEILLRLRREQGLSQEEFAQKLLVTRQAVSRWETGETIPSTDTLKRIAQTFQVSVDHLLGRPAAFCQSCGMRLEEDSDRGTEADGSASEEYCAYCYQQGRFSSRRDHGGDGGAQSAVFSGVEPGKRPSAERGGGSGGAARLSPLSEPLAEGTRGAIGVNKQRGRPMAAPSALLLSDQVSSSMMP